MQPFSGIHPERVEYGVASRRDGHRRNLAQTGGRIVVRAHSVGATASRSTPNVGAGCRALVNAVIRVRLARDAQPQVGAAYG